MPRQVFFVSDGTGITAEALGHSLITQFHEMEFITTTLPYIDNEEKALLAVEKINAVYSQTGQKPLIFATLVNPEIRNIFLNCHGKLLDLFQAFLNPLEKELNAKSSYTIGRSHSLIYSKNYTARIDAINYALANDDGLGAHNYDKADLIIVGVSRSGKTPTCLYLALQFGVLAANYPLTEEDLNQKALPKILQPYKDKLFGLTINVNRLQAIRNERRNNSRYASFEQCEYEISSVEKLYHQNKITYLDTTDYSIEEISTKILEATGIERRLF